MEPEKETQIEGNKKKVSDITGDAKQYENMNK